VMTIAERMLGELSSESKWAKHAWERENGTKCLIGAYSFLTTGDARSHIGVLIYDPYLARLAGIVKEQFPERYQARYLDDKSVLMAFNDHPVTGFPDIRLVLEKAVTE
jgi:hypothetical protein